MATAPGALCHPFSPGVTLLLQPNNPWMHSDIDKVVNSVAQCTCVNVTRNERHTMIKDILLATAIAIGLALSLVAWWSA